MAAEEDPLIRFRSTSSNQESPPVNMMKMISFLFIAVVVVIIVTQSVFVVQPGKIGRVIALGQVTAVNRGCTIECLWFQNLSTCQHRRRSWKRRMLFLPKRGCL